MFSSQEYWDQKYCNGEVKADEWYLPYKALKPIYQDCLMVPRSCILLLGPGFSSFPEELYDVGPKAIYCLEVSTTVCDHFNTKNAKARHGLLYKVGSIVDEPHFDLNSFTLIIDKGTLDSILCGGVDGYNHAEKALKNLYDMMRTPGTFIFVSHSPPVDRLEFINTCYWHEVKVKRAQSISLTDVISKVEDQFLEDIDAVEAQEYDPKYVYVYVCLK